MASASSDTHVDVAAAAATARQDSWWRVVLRNTRGFGCGGALVARELAAGTAWGGGDEGKRRVGVRCGDRETRGARVVRT